MSTLTDKDLQQIKKMGAKQETVLAQIKNFENGFPYAPLAKPATVPEGIVRMSENEALDYANKFDKAGISPLKFVPASGAASRMFKDLFSALEGFQKTGGAYEMKAPVKAFFDRIKEFAFYEELNFLLSDKGGLNQLMAEKQYALILSALLEENGLNYGNLPKGLLSFHRYADAVRTPVEEHLTEGAHYARQAGKVKLHFTVSPEHREKFLALLAHKQKDYEARYGVKYEIALSEQKKSTDTIAVDMHNKPFRNEDGTLLFRPGGHGALIENLNELDADIIFVKNIDNVVPDRIKSETYLYKKALAGLLLELQAKVFDYLAHLNDCNEHYLQDAAGFLENKLFNALPGNFSQLSKKERIAYLKDRFNRPMRVCGMVKNEGEPGGGPFWVTNSDGSISLQIVESAQIDPASAEAQAMMANSTHFNPVDLVCATKDRNGKKFDLRKFVDPLTGFITQKSKDGKDLKAQELPGLWNGAMAGWLTAFVEVPAITFNPVKTVNDLLREEHKG